MMLRFLVQSAELSTFSPGIVRSSWIWRPSYAEKTAVILILLLHQAAALQVIRYGEALHPGPDLWFGATNPSVIANKEFIYGTLPSGAWGISETHLTAIGQRRNRVAFKQVSRRQKGRHLSCHYGAPVELRARSAEAGAWSGVMMVGDAVFRPVTLLWEAEEFRLGRVQTAEAWVGGLSTLVTNIHGWAKSPT